MVVAVNIDYESNADIRRAKIESLKRNSLSLSLSSRRAPTFGKALMGHTYITHIYILIIKQKIVPFFSPFEIADQNRCVVL